MPTSPTPTPIPPSSGLVCSPEPESGGGAPRLSRPLGCGGRMGRGRGSRLCPIGQARSVPSAVTAGLSPPKPQPPQLSALRSWKTPPPCPPVLRSPRELRNPSSCSSQLSALRGPAPRSLRSHHAAKVSLFAVLSRAWGRGAWDPPELGLRAPDGSGAAQYRRRCPQLPTASGHTWTCRHGRQGAAQG